MKVVYLDSSAIVKLIVKEPESDALLGYLADHAARVSSALARTEVLRALIPAGSAALRRGEAVLESIELISVTDEVLVSAARLKPAALRSLDALHIATAALLGDDLEAVVTYDRRMAEGATLAGIRVDAPGQ